MIENMRKYNGLMAVVIVLLAAGLILTMGAGDPVTGGRGSAAKAYGQEIDEVKFREMGVSTLRVINQSSDPSNPYSKFSNPLVRYANELGAGNYFFGGTVAPLELRRFVIRRFIVQKEAAKLGIYASREKAVEFIQTQLFSTKEGTFNKERYSAFLDTIGSNGYQQETFIDLVGEYLVNRKLQQVIAGGVEANKELAEQSALFSNQTINASVVTIDIDTYKKQIKPTDEEIKKFWEVNEGRYLSERQLKISYAYEKPVYDRSAPVKPKSSASEKAQKAYDKKFAQWSIYKKKVDNALASKFDDLTVSIDTASGEDFKTFLTKAGLKITTTDFFDASSATVALKNIKTKNQNPLSTELLARPFGSSAEYRLQAPIKTSGSGWVYVNFEEEKLSEPKTFEAAKELAKADLVAELAKAKMNTESANIKEQLITATNGGKSVKSAAKALDLKVETIKDVKRPVERSYGGLTATSPLNNAVFSLAAATSPGSFTKDDWETPTDVTLVYLNSRKVNNDAKFIEEQADARIGASNQLQGAVYRSWLSAVIRQADIPDSY